MTPAPDIAAAGQRAAAREPARRRRDAAARGAGAAALFLLPSTVLFLVFVLGPIIASLILTLFRWDGLSSATFIGLDNYRTLCPRPAGRAPC